MAGFFEILKEKLRSHHAEPNAQSWAKMEALIDAEPALNPRESRLPAFKKWTAAAVLLLFAGLGLWYFFPYTSLQNKWANEPKGTNKPAYEKYKDPLNPKEISNGKESYNLPKPVRESTYKPILHIKSTLKPFTTNKDNGPASAHTPANHLNPVTKAFTSNKNRSSTKNKTSFQSIKPQTQIISSTNNSSRAKILEHSQSSSSITNHELLNLPIKKIAYPNRHLAEPYLENMPLAKQLNLHSFKSSRWQPRVNLLAAVYSGANESSFGLGVELELQKNGWQASLGFLNHNVNLTRQITFNKKNHKISQQEHAVITGHIHMQIDSTWVILGFNKGEYDIDTSYRTVYDTNTFVITDTNMVDNWINHTATTTMSYAEIPLHLNYGWQWKKWEFLAGAGITTGFLTQKIGAERGTRQIEKHTLSDASIRLGLRYHINSRWSILLRPNYRFNLWQSQPLRTTSSRSSLQWGLSLAL